MKKTLTRFFYFSKSSTYSLFLIAQISFGTSIVLATLYIFAKLSHKMIDRELELFDSIITTLIHSLRTPLLTDVMTLLTFFGGQIFLGSAIILTILILIIKSYKKDASIFSFILFFGIGLNLWLKQIFQRPRPDLSPLIEELSYSFPSGHAMNSFVFYICLTYFIFHNTRNKMLGFWLSAFAIIWVFLIGTSRIYLGVHYPSDVIAGFAAGLLWFAIVLLFEKTLIFLRLFKQYEIEKKY